MITDITIVIQNQDNFNIFMIIFPINNLLTIKSKMNPEKKGWIIEREAKTDKKSSTEIELNNSESA